MTLVMPLTSLVGVSFEIQRVDYVSPETGGRQGAVAAGFPLWRMRLNLGVMFGAEEDRWRAFLASLRGARRQFVAIDPTRRAPLSRARNVTTATWSQAIVGDDDQAMLTMEDLRPATVLSPGDYIGFRWDAAGDEPGTKRALALVRVTGSATTWGQRSVVDAAGEVTVEIEPPVPTIVPNDAEVYFHDAGCLMRLIPNASQVGAQVLGGHTEAGGVVEALQDLIP